MILFSDTGIQVGWTSPVNCCRGHRAWWEHLRKTGCRSLTVLLMNDGELRFGWMIEISMS